MTLRYAAAGVALRLVVAAVLLSSAAVFAQAQTISAKPSMLAFAAPECANDPPAQTVSLTNTGSGALSWQLANPMPAGFAVSSMTGTAPATITIKPPAGLPVGIHRFTLVINSNDPATPSLKVAIVVVIHPCAPGRTTTSAGTPPAPPAMYDVLIDAKGFAGEFSTLPDCKVKQNGYDRLIGTLYGYETNTPDDDVVYKGVLYRETSVDYCMTRGRRRPADDERVYCTVSLYGEDIDEIELTVYGDSARGAWMKATPLRFQTGQLSTGYTSKRVTSDCDAQETSDVKNGYPNADDGGGLSPNGQAIDDLNATDLLGQRVTFYSKRVARLRVGTYPPDRRNGTGNGWTLWVVKKIH